MNQTKRIFFSVAFFCLLCDQLCAQLNQIREEVSVEEVHVGVVLDMGSWEGKIAHSCISMAISDFYSLHNHYRTRVVLHTRDSKGEPLRALSAALELLKNIKVGAIFGAQTSTEAKFLAELGHKAQVPIVSFSAPTPFPSGTKYPYFVQITHDQTSEIKGIVAIIGAFRWRNVVLIYEDTYYEDGIIPYLVNSFQEKNIHVAHKSSIAASTLDDQIIGELHKLLELQTTVFVVHMSSFLASRVFSSVKRLGMMSEGYVWIMTATSMNYLQRENLSAIESMQGVIGLKPYIPASKELHNFTSRWRRKLSTDNMEVVDLSVSDIWAYDAIWVLAKAAERAWDKQPHNIIFDLMDLDDIRTTAHGSTFLKEILQTECRGLSGESQFVNGKLIFDTFEIVNVIGRGDRRVGFWTSEGKITKQLHPSSKRRCLSSTIDLEAIVWPGGSAAIPIGQMMQLTKKTLRIGLLVNSGFPEFVKVYHDLQSNATTATGFCIDVFKAAAESLQYDYEFIPFENTSGMSYNDLITSELYHQNFDVVVGDMTITANRSLYVDFTLPYTDLGVGMIAPKYNKNMWIFLKPLTGDLWLSSAAFCFFTGCVVWLFERPVNEEFQGSRSQQIGTIFWFSLSTLALAHREKLLSNLSKFVVSVWIFAVLILTSSYTATLTSMLTVEQFNLNSKGNYIGYQQGSFALPEVINNLNFKDTTLQPYISPQDYADALSRGSKNGGVSAIVDEIPYIKAFLAKYSADYYMVNQMSTTNGFAFAFPKGSPLVSNVSRAIADMRQEGKLAMLEEAWFGGGSTLTSGDSTNNPDALNLYRFRGLFLITGISSTLALVIFLISVLHKNWHCIVRNCRKLVHLIAQRLGFVKKYLSNRIFNVSEEI